MSKVISFSIACQLSKQLQKQGKRVLFTSGCFDILHLGHVRFLQMAKKWGRNAVLFVGVETDEYLRISKGSDKPVFSQRVRAEMLAALAAVDYVIILFKTASVGSSAVFIKRYRKLAPSVVLFGNTEKRIIEAIKVQTKVAGCDFRHLPHRTKLDSSSRIAKLILDNFPP